MICDPNDIFGKALFALYVAEMERLETADVAYFDAAVRISGLLDALLATTFASIENVERCEQMIALFKHSLRMKVDQMRAEITARSSAMETMQ